MNLSLHGLSIFCRVQIFPLWMNSPTTRWCKVQQKTSPLVIYIFFPIWLCFIIFTNFRVYSLSNSMYLSGLFFSNLTSITKIEDHLQERESEKKHKKETEKKIKAKQTRITDCGMNLVPSFKKNLHQPRPYIAICSSNAISRSSFSIPLHYAMWIPHFFSLKLFCGQISWATLYDYFCVSRVYIEANKIRY